MSPPLSAADNSLFRHVAIKKVKLDLRELPLEDSGVAYLNGISHTVYREIKIMRELDHQNLISVRITYAPNQSSTWHR